MNKYQIVNTIERLRKHYLECISEKMVNTARTVREEIEYFEKRLKVINSEEEKNEYR